MIISGFCYNSGRPTDTVINLMLPECGPLHRDFILFYPGIESGSRGARCLGPTKATGQSPLYDAKQEERDQNKKCLTSK
jgi:hypothetical protein